MKERKKNNGFPVNSYVESYKTLLYFTGKETLHSTLSHYHLQFHLFAYFIYNTGIRYHSILVESIECPYQKKIDE